MPCQMHQKRTTNWFLLTTWRMALTTKRAIFCSFLNVIFLEKNIICFWIFVRHLSRKERHLYLFALPNASEKDKKIVPFDYMTFLEKNVICTFCLAKCIRKGHNKCITKGQKEIFLLTIMKNGSLCLAKCHKKSNFCVPFWTSPF